MRCGRDGLRDGCLIRLSYCSGLWAWKKVGFARDFVLGQVESIEDSRGVTLGDAIVGSVPAVELLPKVI